MHIRTSIALDVFDVVSFNLYPGWYEGDNTADPRPLDRIAPTLDEVLARLNTKELRDKPLTQIGTHKIDYTRDYMPGTRTCMADGKSEPMELKGQNVMYYELEGGTTFIIRPSGTEPKVKVYIMAKGENKAEAAEKVEALTAAAKEIVK